MLIARARGHGVLDMALLSVIRRWHFRDHLSIREIARRLPRAGRRAASGHLTICAPPPKGRARQGAQRQHRFLTMVSHYLFGDAG